MNKTQFLKSLADEYELDNKSAKMLLDMVLEHITETILDTHRLVLSDFGTFTTWFKKPRKVADNLKIFGHDPKPKVSSARLQVRFKPAKKFKDLLIERGEDIYAELGLADDEVDLDEDTGDSDEADIKK